jgi:hypothetical protein
LPIDKRLTLDGCLCQVDFLDAQIAVLDREIARLALAWPQVLRLMSVPGVNVQTAATFMAWVGDIRRFSSARARRGPQIAATATGAQARGAVLAPAHARGGLCVRPPGDDPQQDPQARTARRPPAAEGPQGHRGRATPSASSHARPNPPIAGSSAT